MSAPAAAAPVRLMPGGHPEQPPAGSPAGALAPACGSPAAKVPGCPVPSAPSAGPPAVRAAATGGPRPVVVPKGPPTATIQLPANFQLPPGECVPRAAGPHACPPASSFRAGKGELRQLCEMGKVGMSAPRVGSGMLFCPVRRVGEVRVFACLVGREERRRLEPGTVRGARST